MKRLTRVLVAVLFGWIASASAQEKFGWFLQDKLDFERSPGKLRLEGRARLPEGTRVSVQIHFKGPTQESHIGTLEDGQIQFNFTSLKGRILAGNYLIRLEVRRQDQTPVVLEQLRDIWPTLTVVDIPVKAGDDAEQKIEEKMVRDKLLLTVNYLHMSFTRLEQTGNYTLANLEREKAKAEGGEIPPETRQLILQSWDRFCRGWWEDFYDIGVSEFNDYRDNVFASLFPEAEENIKSLVLALQNLRASFWSDVARLTGADVPQYAQTDALVPRNGLLRTVRDSASAFYRAMGMEGQEWHVVLIGEVEQGEIQGNVYRSEHAQFQIEKPEGWTFEPLSYHPGIRLRVKPADATLERLVFADVEIKYFPEAENHDDLVEYLEIGAHERWPGYRKLSARPVSVKDNLVKGGVRKGYELDYHAELEQRKFRVDEYNLFCQSGRRTFGVTCVAAQERSPEFQAAFDLIKKGFKVLDQPPPEEPARREGKREGE